MPHLNVNFNDVPDVIKNIDPGKYLLEVAKVPALEPSKSGTGQNLIIDFRVSTEGEFYGRSVRDYIFLNEFGLVKAKQFIKGCGCSITSDGINTEELLGCKIDALLVKSAYKDDATGETIENTKVSKYVVAE